MYSLQNKTNIVDILEERLPPDLVGCIRKAGETAAERGEQLYLVGGAVRDMLLGRGTLDIDLVVEGNAISLAETLAGQLGGKVTAHRPLRYGDAETG